VVVRAVDESSKNHSAEAVVGYITSTMADVKHNDVLQLLQP